MTKDVEGARWVGRSPTTRARFGWAPVVAGGTLLLAAIAFAPNARADAAGAAFADVPASDAGVVSAASAASSPAPSQAAPAPAPAAGSSSTSTPPPSWSPAKPGEFTIPGTGFTIHVGGFARLDLIHDFNGMGDPAQFVPWTIPLNGSGKPNTYFDARKSRLFVEARYPNSFADLTIHLEGDFFTDSNSFRLRRAFAALGRVLVGQEWSVFTNPDWTPPTLDFENPIAYVTQRSPQVRYTQPLGVKGLTAAFSLEYLQAKLSPELADAVPGQVRNLVPDTVLRVLYDSGSLYASLHGLMRNLFYDVDGGDREYHFGWGVNAIFGYAFTGGHRVYAQGIAGNAIGSYRGVYDFKLDNAGKAVPAKAYGGTVGTQVQWLQHSSHKLSSNITGSVTHSVGDPLNGTTNGRLATYYALNLVWAPIVYFSAGVEYLYGRYQDYSDRQGHDHRLLISTRASLP